MFVTLANLNVDMCKEHSGYVLCITGSDDYDKRKLDYFISGAVPYLVVVTILKLLSTGADCKMMKLIVLDQNINSMMEFKQIVDRGTHMREKEGNLFLVVMNFRNEMKLFPDSD